MVWLCTGQLVPPGRSVRSVHNQYVAHQGKAASPVSLKPCLRVPSSFLGLSVAVSRPDFHNGNSELLAPLLKGGS